MLIEKQLYCWAWNRIYIKANGRVPCWCDSGEPYTVVHKPFEEVDFVTDIVNSEEMRAMRGKILFAQQPYIEECATCCCMIDNQRGHHFRYADRSKPGVTALQKSRAAAKVLQHMAKKRNWPIGSIDKIAEIQLEPSFPCNLSCPGCLQGFHPNPLSTEPGPHIFPFKWFQRILDSITKHEVQLKRIAFVGRGEPTLNKDYPEMIRLARSTLPNIIMSMDTNSNQQFKDEYLDLNWINCSIDGSDQESYAKYRVGGKIQRAIEFLRAASARKRELQSTCQIRWKFILFDTNDSNESLNRAQNLANEIGIDELDFVITHCGAHDHTVNPSQRFPTLEKLNQYLNQNKIFDKSMGSRAT